eukprot:Hpha_TRINITY_DN7514_c0_g1::TRINITY_DN7514_c0_g1_i1::g.19027::m.19027
MAKSWNLQQKVQDLHFVVPPHLKAIRDKVLRFVEDDCIPYERELLKLSEAGHVTPALKQQAMGRMDALQQKAKDQGLWALGHPKELGGGGMPFRDYIYVNEIIGRCELSMLALGTHSLQDCLMLFNHASKEIKDKYIYRLAKCEIRPSFAMTEPDVVSSDPTGIRTTATLTEDKQHWIINGRKWWTTGAEEAEFTCVMVRTEKGKGDPHLQFSIILVPTSTPGYKIVRSTSVLGVHGVSHAEVEYNNVKVPVSNLVGRRGFGFLIAQERLGPGRIFHCMRWIGQAQRAFDLMCKRLCSRRLADGKTLGRLQLMQEHVYDSFCDIQAMRLMTLSAAEKMDSGDYARIELAAVKAWGARALNRVADRAIQVHGAAGLSEDFELSTIYRLARAARFYDGPDEVHISTVGRLVLRDYAKGNRYDFSSGLVKPSGELVKAKI